jgi:aminoglycoside phosphotransferase (APT) family kinase protein
VTDNRLTIDPALVRQLVDTQFPQWAKLSIKRVPLDGWDNSTFRLGEDMKVRLPTAARYVAQVEKEQRWLPYLAPRLPLPVPVPLAAGVPNAEYPFPWSVYQWLRGNAASTKNILNLNEFAKDLAQFLIALQRIPAEGGPSAGPHSFFRGGPLGVYDSETRRYIEELGKEIDSAAASAVWETALDSRWTGPDVWVHGDIAAGNLLVVEGNLSAVIDFGSCAVGDPACDLVIAWTLFTGQSRATFRSIIKADETVWARARGWALWKALLNLSTGPARNKGLANQDALRIVADVVAEQAPRPTG